MKMIKIYKNKMKLKNYMKQKKEMKQVGLQ